MITNDEPITLTTLGGGAAVEKFDDAFQRVLDNIVDPNTKPDAVREIILKVKIKPDENRNVGHVIISCDPKLAPESVFRTTCAIGSVNGKGVAREYVHNMPLFEGEKTDNVVEIDRNGTQKEG